MSNRYVQELDAIQRWVYRAAQLKSIRLQEAPPKVARPVILWEAASRGRDRHLSRWSYINGVVQFGKLYVNNLDQLYTIQEKLIQALEERVGILPVYETREADSERVGLLKDVKVEFDRGEKLDTLIRVTYEATYHRVRPERAPAANVVSNKLTSKGG